MSSASQNFDVCVLGSGFAGSLTALVLAKSGMSVAIIDRAAHPRFAIGESSTPAADYLLHELAQRYQIAELIPLCRFGTWRESYPQMRCGCKRGFSYVWHGAGSDYRASPTHNCELMVAANASQYVSDTQWYRPDVDQFLFELAVRYGAKAYERTEIAGVRRKSTNGREPWQIDCLSELGMLTMNANFIIDASGPTSRFMQTQLPVDLTDSLSTNTSAVYTHFENCRSTLAWLESQHAVIDDFPYPFDQAAVHHLFHDGWLWKIGFEGNLTSVGYVIANRSRSYQIEAELNNSSSAADADGRWLEILKRHPVLSSILGGATQAAMPGKLLGAERVQRLISTCSGQDWAALPFTVGFIDPLHSTGIAHSLSAILRVCDALLSTGPTKRADLLSQYANDLQAEFRHLDQLISGCYDALIDFRLFNCWTMLYFAAATTFERRYRLGEATSFLLSNDAGFRQRLLQARQSLNTLSKQTTLTDALIESYQREVRDLIAPYNTVGLFAPQHSNMYRHTAAEK